MKFLLDQDVYFVTYRFLKDSGHDVVRAAEIGLSQSEDEELISIAQEQDRILITRDRDFGTLVFLKSLGSGVIYLRMLPSTQESVHGELARAIKAYSEEEIKKAFIVIEPDGYRFRRIQSR